MKTGAKAAAPVSCTWACPPEARASPQTENWALPGPAKPRSVWHTSPLPGWIEKGTSAPSEEFWKRRSTAITRRRTSPMPVLEGRVQS